MRDFFYILTIIVLFTIPSCVQENDDRWKEKYEVRIDTLLKNDIALLQDSIDSLCLSKYEELLTSYVDSIKTIRREEIRKLIEDE